MIKDLRERLEAPIDPRGRARVLDGDVRGLARDLGRIVTRDTQAGGPVDVEALVALVAVHWSRHQVLPVGRDRDDLRACLAWSTRLLQVAPHLVPDVIRAHLGGVIPSPGEPINPGGDLLAEYERTGNARHLHAAIEQFRGAVAGVEPGHPDRPRYLSNLGHALRVRFERVGDVGDLAEAIEVGRGAVAGVEPGHPGRPRYLSNLGAALGVRFERVGDVGDLAEAIEQFRAVVAGTEPGHPDRHMYLSNLGVALQSRFGRVGHVGDLAEAIEWHREAVAGTPLGHPNRPRYLSNLGVALRVRFERVGDVGDLTEAIEVGRGAVAGVEPGHPGRPRYLSNLGNALQDRFWRVGDVRDLAEAIEWHREAVAGTEPGHPDRHMYLSNLGNVLQSRFERLGDVRDLAEAIEWHREAVAGTPPGHPNRPRYLSNLGDALRVRFERVGDVGDLTEAIEVGRRAVAGTEPGHPDRPSYLSNLGVALGVRFERVGDVAEAIEQFRAVVAGTEPGHPHRPRYLSILGVALQSRFGRVGDVRDLAEAIEQFRGAVAGTEPEHPDRPTYLFNLGVGLRERFGRVGDLTDLHEAVGLVREGAGVETASPATRLRAAQLWGRWAWEGGDPGAGLEGYRVAVERLLPLVVWHGLDQETREHHLTTVSGLASEAAGCAVAAGDPQAAVELLEAGRSVLWSQALHLRSDLSDLAERAPDLTVALEGARAVLDRPLAGAADVAGDVAVGDAGQGEVAQRLMLDERRQAAQDWDRALAAVRELAGFESFLRPVPFAGLRAAASGGPVVIVNATDLGGGHALVLTPGSSDDSDLGVQVIDLPGLTVEDAITRANALLTAQRRASDAARGWQAREDDRHAVFDVLAWAWEVIAEPVLAALGYTDAPDGPVAEWPQVWWCPTGPLAVLPLHAAGRHPRTEPQRDAMGEAVAIAETVAGRVVSSYTPTLGTLIRARERHPAADARQLVVGVPRAPGQAPLPGVGPELAAVAAHLPPPEKATHLVGPAATRAAVLDAVAAHSWVHLSCHGAQDARQAPRSAFLLHDQPLTLADLVALDLTGADLAYLSACQTATGDVGLLDEALHLAAGLQLVGYRHVLATLWNISDAAAPEMADAIYARLTPDGRPDATHAAHALHEATAALRRAHPGDPLLWAPYIHLGP